jgi:hypothetical protein
MEPITFIFNEYLKVEVSIPSGAPNWLRWVLPLCLIVTVFTSTAWIMEDLRRHVRGGIGCLGVMAFFTFPTSLFLWLFIRWIISLFKPIPPECELRLPRHKDRPPA